MANKHTVFFLAIEYDLYQGHTVYINDLPVAFRKYDGSDAKEVENQVAEAFGALLLDKLREGNPTAWHASQEHSEDPWENEY